MVIYKGFISCADRKSKSAKPSGHCLTMGI